MLGQSVGAQVRIGGIKAAREGFYARFDFSDLELSASPQLSQVKEGVRLSQLQVYLSPWNVLQAKLDQAVIHQPVLQASRQSSGQITIAGFSMKPKTESSQGLDWLLSQPSITIHGGTIEWRDDALNQPIARVTDLALDLRNSLGRHQAFLSATPPTLWGDRILVAGDFTQPMFERSPSRWQSWSGQIYTKLLAPQPEYALRAASSNPDSAWLSASSLLSASKQVQIWTQLSEAKVSSVTASVEQAPKFASRLQLEYQVANRLLQLSATDVQTDALFNSVRSLTQIKPETAEFLSSTLKNGLIEDMTLEVKDLSKVRLQASFRNPDMAGDLVGSWDRSVKPAGFIDMSARLSKLELSTLPRYLPPVTPAPTRQYLERALIAGTASKLELKFKGSLANSKPDMLHATGVLNGLQLAFAPSWPKLTQANAQFELSNNSLNIDHIEANLGDLPLKGHIRIADLDRAVLDISAQAQKTTFEKVLNIAKQIPAAQSALNQAKAYGLVDLKAQLSLPLANLANSRYNLEAQLVDNSLQLLPQAPTLSAINGKIFIRETGIDLQNLDAQMLGGSINLSGERGQIKGQGFLTVDGLKAWQPRFDSILKKVQGQISYSLKLDPDNLQISSNLQGLALDLPEPLNKSSSVEWPTSLERTKDGLIKLTMGEKLDVQLLTHLDKWIGNIAVGQTASKPDKDQDGIHIGILLPQLDVSAWQNIIGNSAEASGASNSTSNFLITQVSAQIQDLVWKERHFEQVVVGASKTNLGVDANNTAWRINALATDFNGYAEYRLASGGKQTQLFARLARLSIPDTRRKTELEQLLETPQTNLPDLDVVIEDLEMVGKKLGQLEVVANNQNAVSSINSSSTAERKQEWHLKTLSLTNADATLSATGTWTLPSQSSASKVNLQFNWMIENSGDLLTRLGLPGTIKNGKGQLQGRVGWFGSPVSLNYPSLSGQVNLDMAEGQFLKIDPGVGRLISVLSLQALPRRLAFNFRDVFSEGFSFDSITGDAQIKEGVIETNNLKMKSVLALVTLKGSADIAKETQQLRVHVLPDVNAGGASILAAIVNPVVGAATYLVQWVLRRPISNAATKAYKIEGTWQKPIVTSIPP